MTSFAIKCIALVTMILDHITYLSGMYYDPLHLLGRIAFPIYVFLVAEGCRHTRNKGKFLLRLLVFAFISQVPYSMLLRDSVLSWRYPNIFFCLFFGVLAVFFYEYIKSKSENKWMKWIAILPLALMIFGIDWTYFRIDGGGVIGMTMIFCTYLAATKKRQMIVIALGCFYLYLGSTIVMLYKGIYDANGFNIWPYVQDTCFALLSLIPIALYNGQRGRPIKWAFYWAYPLHLAILANIAAFLA